MTEGEWKSSELRKLQANLHFDDLICKGTKYVEVGSIVYQGVHLTANQTKAQSDSPRRYSSQFSVQSRKS